MSAGSNPAGGTNVLSQDIGDDVSRHSRHLVLCRWLVVPTRIDGEATHEDALGVEDPDVTVGDQHRHHLVGVPSTHAQVQ